MQNNDFWLNYYRIFVRKAYNWSWMIPIKSFTYSKHKRSLKWLVLLCISKHVNQSCDYGKISWFSKIHKKIELSFIEFLRSLKTYIVYNTILWMCTWVSWLCWSPRNASWRVIDLLYLAYNTCLKLLSTVFEYILSRLTTIELIMKASGVLAAEQWGNLQINLPVTQTNTVKVNNVF